MTLCYVTCDVTTSIGYKERRTYVRSVSEELDSVELAVSVIESWIEEAKEEYLDVFITGIFKL